MGTKLRRKINNYAGRNYSKKRVAEVQSPKSRSTQMSKIRSKGTKFELEFIKILEGRTNSAFLTHVKSIIGYPDIVFENERICIFLDSDFWHGWQYPRWKHLLKDNFWREKIERNRRRDKYVTKFLRRQGWIVIRVWEHQLKNSAELNIQKILKVISK
jgi:DNA mismatch endonuclease, patch repair protein